MRRLFNPQLELGATPIEDIVFNVRSRDDIPQLLRGLQHIYTNPGTREAVFDVLHKNIGSDVSFENGRPGMDLWILLVLGTLRLGLNCDYDRLHELANEHKTVRAMLGHGDWRDEHLYGLQTLKDNIMLLTGEMLEEINAIVVNAGHALVKKKEEDTLRGRCDSFVVEINVEYPTDSGMLWDAMRKTLLLTSRLCKEHKIDGWRQVNYNLQRIKSHWRKTQKTHRSRKADAEENKQKAYKAYLRVTNNYYEKSLESVKKLQETGKQLCPSDWSHLQNELEKIAIFQEYAALFQSQIRRRVLEDEVIPQEEKVYSIFQPHTEWVSKGKAGVPVELGLKVCIMEDQFQFILHHTVMEKTQDVDVAVSMVTETQKHFPSLKVCSYDKGFHSPANQKELRDYLEDVILPKKGKLSSEEKTSQHTPSFKKARRQHSAVESAINGLEHNGLDRCMDHGIEGFKRYIALAVLSRNLQRIGAILTEKERIILKRKRQNGCCAQAA